MIVPTSLIKKDERPSYKPSCLNDFPLRPIEKPEREEIIIKSQLVDVHLGVGSRRSFSSKYISLQKNGKLIVYTPADPYGDAGDDEDPSDLLCPAILTNLWEQGNVLQTNRSKSCQVVAAIDLQYLFPGTKVFRRDKDKEIEVDIYEFERADTDYDDSNPYGFSQQWEKIAFKLIMRFDNSSCLDSWFSAINGLL